MLECQDRDARRSKDVQLSTTAVWNVLALQQRYTRTAVVSTQQQWCIVVCLRALQVLYQVFDWPNQPGSRLAVIGISNTHDLDQRVLPRIASRLDQAKLAFAPYSVQQLQTIVGQRLQDSGVAGAVEEMAIMLACRKVASETGEGLGGRAAVPVNRLGVPQIVHGIIFEAHNLQ